MSTIDGLMEYENWLTDMYREDIALCREILKLDVGEYNESGDDADLSLVLQNLRRVIKARGYEAFEAAHLSEAEIDEAIYSEQYYNRDIVNKMLEAFDVDARLM